MREVIAAGSPIEVNNGIVKYMVNSDGGFLIKTEAGNPLRDQDKKKWLLYADEKQDTSFTTIRIDGEDYIFGKSYGFSLAKKAYLVGETKTIEQATLTKWAVGDVHVTQKLELVEDKTNPNYGNVLIQYMVENKTGSTVEVGSRILLDTMIGTNDGAGLKVGSDFIDTETAYVGQDVPEIWRLTDNEFAPKVIGYGFTKGWGNRAPDKMIVAHWQGLSESAWDYTVKNDLNFTIESDYGKKDTAIALYFEPKALEAGKTTYMETYYGIGEIPEKAFTYNVQLSSISKLTVNESYTGYNESEFEITAYVENNLPSSTEVYDVTATIDFEEGIELISSETKSKVKRLLKKNGQYAFTWKVRAKPQTMYKMIKYRVDIYDKRNLGQDGRVNREDIYSTSRFVLVPSINGAPPAIHYNAVSPNKLYYSGKRTFTIKGSGFEMYQDTSKWELSLKHVGTGIKTLIPADQIVILDDNSMMATTEQTLAPGQYNIVIKDNASEEVLPFGLTITRDRKYLTRTYGMLAIVKDFSYDKVFEDVNYFYRVIPLQGEEQLSKLKAYYKKVSDSDGIKEEKEVLITIKGDVREIRNQQQKLSKYIVYSAHKKAVINDIMTYSSPIPLVISDNKQQILNLDPSFDFDFEYDLMPTFDLFPELGLDIDLDLDMDINLDISLPNLGLDIPEVDLGLPNLSFDMDFDLPDMNMDIDLPDLPGFDIPNFDFGINLDLIKNTYVYIQGAGLLGINTSNGFDFWLDEFSIALRDGQNYTLEGNREEKPEELITVYLEGVGAFLNVMLSGLPVEIHEVIIANRQNKDLLSFGANVTLPFAGGDGQIGIDAKDVLFSKKGYEGLHAEGSIAMPDYGAVKGGAATVSINTFDEIYGMEGEAEIGVLKVEVSFEIMRERANDTWYLNKLVLAGGGDPGIPVVAGSVYVTKLGGGVENLAQLTNPYYGGADIFTVVVLTDVRVVPDFEGSFEGRFNKRLMRIDGELDFARLPIFDTAYLEASWDTDGDEDFYVLGGVTIDIADGLITGGGSMYYSNIFWEGKGKVEFKVPSSVPFVGGKTLAKATAGVNKDKIWGAGSLSVLVATVRLAGTYYWDDGDLDVDFSIASADNYLPSYNGNVQGIYEMDVAHKDKKGTMVYGTNMRVYESRPAKELTLRGYPMAEAGNTLGANPVTSIASSTDNLEHTLYLSKANDYLLELAYDGTLPEVTVTRPDGSELVLSNDPSTANYYTRTGVNGQGMEQQYMVIGLTEKITGQWKVLSSKPTTSKLAEIDPLPELTQASAELSGNEEELIVNWTGSHYLSEPKKIITDAKGNIREIDRSSKVDIYLADDEGSVGRLLLKDVDPTLGTKTITIPEDVQTGDYYVHVALSTEDVAYTSLYSNKLHIVNKKSPGAVNTVSGIAQGNGYLRATWVPTDTSKTSGYYIEVFNSQQEIIEAFGSAYIEGNKAEALIGGKYKAMGSDKVLGLETGETYRIGVTPVYEENGKKYYGQITYSGDVFLPEPNPPTLSIQMDGENPATGYVDGEGNSRIGVTKRDVKLQIASNQEVEIEVHLDQKKLMDISGRHMTIPMYQLTDGEHVIDLVAKNSEGDITVERYMFTVDTKAPILLIDSPTDNGIVQGGVAKVVGSTNAGAVLKVNNQLVTVDEEGKFSKMVPVRNSYKDTITVTAEDNLGNASTAEIQVINGDVKPLKRVKLTPDLSEVEVGSTIDLKLTGIQEDGREMVLGHDQITYELLEGDTIATLTKEGKLTLEELGDVVVLATYKITDDYAFQDGLVIEVIPKKPAPVYNDDSGSSNGEENKEQEQVEKLLGEILNNLIKEKTNVKVLKTYTIRPDEELFVQNIDQLTVLIEKETVNEEDKVFIGKVTDVEKYVDEEELKDTGNGNETGLEPKKRIVSDIYELEIIKSQRRINKPVEIHFNYKEEEVKNPENLVVYRYNDYMENWEYVGGMVDLSMKKVVVKLEHFSKYALFETYKMKEFRDIQNGRWSREKILALASLGVIDGIQGENGRYFEPKRAITRGEFIKLFTMVKKLDVQSGDLSKVFIDWQETPTWVRPYLYTSYKSQLLNGQEIDGKLYLRSNSDITRAEAIALIGRGLDMKIDQPKEKVKDHVKIPSYARTFVYGLMDKGILSGYADGSVKPQNAITREEAATLIYNMVDYYNK